MKDYKNFNPRNPFHQIHTYRNTLVFESNEKREQIIKDAILCYSCDRISLEGWEEEFYTQISDRIAKLEFEYLDSCFS